jgi:Integrase core domain/IstB-like ATP binding protein
VIVTSNRVIADWGAYLGDNTMATTLLDRLGKPAENGLIESFNGRLRDECLNVTEFCIA